MELPGLIQFRYCSLTDQDLAEKVADGLNKMYKPPFRLPARNIPARPDEDFDLILGELIVRFIEKVELLQQSQANRMSTKIYNEMIEVFEFTKEQLIEAFKRYNLEYLANKDEFVEISDSEDTAIAQAEKLLSILQSIA